MSAPKIFNCEEAFQLESGARLNRLTIAYHSWGELNNDGSNVIWVCHALTANSNAKDWWPGLIGKGLVFDTDKYFVVCANILGSCYGTTGPGTISDNGRPYHHEFPFITIRDIVNAHELLRVALGIESIFLLAGGSMGGYQVLEWCVMKPEIIHRQFLIASNAQETAWAIAIHTTQRMAIELDPGWQSNAAGGGSEGLKIARGIGMVTYRSYESFSTTQTDTDDQKTDSFRAESYIRYQGEKLSARFSAYSYWALTKAMDSHNLARGRSALSSVLSSIQARTLVIAITSDLLCPLEPQQFLARQLPNASFVVIDSLYGHDGFLVETPAVSQHLSDWLNN